MPTANFLIGRVNASQARLVTPIALHTVTTGNLPAHTGDNGASLVVVTDGAGGLPVLALSDGTDWRRADTLNAVSLAGLGALEEGLAADVTGISGVQIISDAPRAVRHLQIQLTDVDVLVTAANDFGGAQILNFPDTNLIILGVETDIVITKGGQANGIIATTDLSVSLGTATAAANPPAGDAANVLSVATITTDALTVDYERHTGDETTPAAVFINDGPTSGLFLNVGAVGGIIADDNVTASGTIDFYYVDTGNVAS